MRTTTYLRLLYFSPLFFLLILGCSDSNNPKNTENPKNETALNEFGDFGGSSVRHYAGMGTKGWDKKAFDKPDDGWINKEWDKVLEIATREAPEAFDGIYPTLGAKAEWSKAYVDETIKPTREQGQDPNWSNYVWNQREDGISNALNSPLIDNGNGKAKLSILVGITSTSGQNLPPKWMRDDSTLTWEEGTNQNGANGNFHVRYDNPEAIAHVADFMTAFLKKFGNNTGVHSICLGEYYRGQKEYRPNNMDANEFYAGARDLWQLVVNAAPKDENGNRVNILQVNPLFQGDVTADDLEHIGIGISRSDTYIDLPITKSKETTAMKKLYDGKKVHVMIEGDSRFARQGKMQKWDGTPNPFGHNEGYEGVATPEEIYWYHGEKGPAPVYSIILRSSGSASNHPQTKENIINAIKQFGRGGVNAKDWGPTPSALPQN